MLTGGLLRDGGGVVVLRDPTGKEINIPSDQIAGRTPIPSVVVETCDHATQGPNARRHKSNRKNPQNDSQGTTTPKLGHQPC